MWVKIVSRPNIENLSITFSPPLGKDSFSCACLEEKKKGKKQLFVANVGENGRRAPLLPIYSNFRG